MVSFFWFVYPMSGVALADSRFRGGSRLQHERAQAGKLVLKPGLVGARTKRLATAPMRVADAERHFFRFLKVAFFDEVL